VIPRGGICQAYSLITLLPFFNLQPTLSNVGTYTNPTSSTS